MPGGGRRHRARVPLVLREAAPILAVLVGVTLLLLWAFRWAAPLPLLLLGFTLWFFRDPERVSAARPGEVVSPADGTVLSVTEVVEPRHVQGPSLCVRIYLSLFDVHVNRSPIAGTVTYRDDVAGQFLPAFTETGGERNERAYVGLVAGPHRVLVVQIAGRIARRIVTWPRIGDRLQRAERFGLIRFGSCTQVFLPAGSTVTVAPGDKVRGGLTVIGRLPDGAPPA